MKYVVTYDGYIGAGLSKGDIVDLVMIDINDRRYGLFILPRYLWGQGHGSNDSHWVIPFSQLTPADVPYIDLYANIKT